MSFEVKMIHQCTRTPVIAGFHEIGDSFAQVSHGLEKTLSNMPQ
jgi:hypothetical protein